MKLLTQWGWRGLLALVLIWGATGATLAQQPAKQDDKPKVSSGEADLIKKVNSAPKLADKIEIAKKFLEKYPKSAARARLAEAHEFSRTRPAKRPQRGEIRNCLEKIRLPLGVVADDHLHVGRELGFERRVVAITTQRERRQMHADSLKSASA